MTEMAQANDIKVILCSVLPAFDYPWRPGLAPNVKIPKLNKMIKRYAEESGAYYLDYFTALEDGNNGMIKEYTTDGVHLTLEGYQVMEPLVENALQKVLN
jgi:lysophospholipase L1-like esterase